MTVVIGPNGAGKSTMCDTIIGRVRPTSGRVLFHGEAIQNELEHRIVGKGICRKFQTPGVLIGLSVIDNLAIAAMADCRWWKSFGKAGEDDRSEARRVGDAWGRTCRSRGSCIHYK